MKYLIATLGCKVNQFETQAMEERLLRDGHMPAAPGEQADAVLRDGHMPAAPGEQADAVIVNTCAVTAESGRKSRQMIRRLHDENPNAVVAVCGCYAQLSPEENAEIGASVIFGTGDRMAFVEAVERAVASGEAVRQIDRPFSRKTIELLPAGAVSGRTRAMLKIQDGCRNFCTYCIIGEMRLRLGSLEPTVITEDFCRRLADTGKLCRHFHLSLQSGCDRTLKAMNRKYDTAFFFHTTELLRQYFPGCALTGDLIAGFPGETEADHAETLSFLRLCEFSELHVFPYSRRPGTPADKLPDQAGLDRNGTRFSRSECGTDPSGAV